MNLVSETYNSNPQFSFVDQFKLSLDRVYLDDFNQTYEKLFKSYRLQKIEIEQLEMEINLNLDRIFKNFDDQIPEDLDYKDYLIEYLSVLKKMLFESIKSNINILYYDSHKFNKNNFDNNYNKFLEDKYTFKILDIEIKNKILDICNSKINYFNKLSQTKVCSRDELSVNGGILIKRVIYLLNKNFNSNGTNDLISKYMNTEYEVTGCALELSPSNSNWWIGYGVGSEKTKYAHIDNSPIYPKAICYLTNVSFDNGPTSFFPKIYDELNINHLQDLIGRNIPLIGDYKNTKYIKNIIRNNNNFFEDKIVRKIFMTLPSELLFNSHIGWDINPDSELESKFLKSEKKFIAKSGSYVVFDGARLFHRGGMVKSDFRVALQIVFGKKLSKLSKLKNIINNVSKKFFI
jgi:hypothetical protein